MYVSWGKKIIALKDIRHLNRPPSHLSRQGLFPGFAVHHHNQHAKNEHHLTSSRQEQMQKSDQQRQLQQGPHNSQAFLDSQSENMKREALESRLDSENAYMDQVDLSLAAAAAAAAAAHHHNAAGLHHPNSRHHEMENNMHKGTSQLILSSLFYSSESIYVLNKLSPFIRILSRN